MSEQIAATARIVEEVIARSQQALEELVKTSREQAEKAGVTLKANFEEVTDINQKNIAALVESTKIFARAVEEASQAIASFSQKNSEASIAAMTKLASAKSVTEAVEIQQAFAKDSVSSLVAEAERLATLANSTARDALAPLNERVAAAAELLTKPLAA